MLRGLAHVNVISGESEAIVEFEGKEYGGFYISYNFSRYDYGCPTTALVLGQMQKFFILKGDYRKQYADIFDKGFYECLSYFKDNISNAHEYSDTIK